MHKEVYKWLKTLGYKISPTWLKFRLESHPNYPSLLAITETLNEINIPVEGLYIQKENHEQIDSPFLAHMNREEGSTEFVNSIMTVKKRLPNFFEEWSGYILIIPEKQEISENAEHSKFTVQDKFTTTLKNIVIGLSAIALIVCLITVFSINWLTSFNVLLWLVGLYLSYLIVQKEAGINNSVSEAICSLVKKQQCNKLLYSKGSKVFSWLSWGDIGIIFFCCQICYFILATVGLQIFSKPAGESTLISHYFTPAYILSVAALIFPPYSLFYQWKIIKEWCPLCIGVQLVILIIGISIIYQYSGTKEIFSFHGVISYFLLYSLLLGLIGAIWLIVKQNWLNQLQLVTWQTQFQRVKRNPIIYNNVMDKKISHAENLTAGYDILQYGAIDAPIQITIACNPYCAPCANAHHAIDNLLVKYPDQLRITIRFSIRSLNMDTKHNKAINHILKTIMKNPARAEEILKSWYQNKNLERFKNLYPLNGIEYDTSEIFLKMDEWTKNQRIDITPTIFINGKRLYDLYKWMDVTEHLERNILEKLEENGSLELH
jgi:uncharacterized membrane protein